MPTAYKTPAAVWLMRLSWLALPFAAGNVLATALADSEPAWRTTASLALWLIWGFVSLLAWVLHPLALTLLRVWLPTSLVAVGWATVVTQGELAWWETSLAAAVASLATTACLTPPVGMAYTDSASYPAERRLLLRPPLAVLLGPLALMWALAVAGLLAGPWLLASQQWLVGGLVLPVGWLLAVPAHQSLRLLTQRWLVFVPAGLVIHDSLALGAEAKLLETADLVELRIIKAATRRREISEPGGRDDTSGGLDGDKHPSPSGVGVGDSSIGVGDLTLGALGAAVEFHLRTPCQLPAKDSRKMHFGRRLPAMIQTEGAMAVRLAPSLLEEVVTEALQRGLVSPAMVITPVTIR